MIVPEDDATEDTYEPSVCGAEADCMADEDGSLLVAGDAWSWCDEFKMEDAEEEGSMRLVATMAATFTDRKSVV